MISTRLRSKQRFLLSKTMVDAQHPGSGRSTRPAPAVAILIALGVLYGCGSQPTTVAPRLDYQPPQYSGFPPSGFPVPRVPKQNPHSVERENLGRFLFYDTALSGNQTYSCGSCHQQALAFTDGRVHALGATGEDHTLNTMTLTNVAYNATYGWANPSLHTLEHQVVIPMTNQTPVELGIAGLEATVEQRLRNIPRYGSLFEAAFPGESDPIHLANVIKALASFERSLLSADSPYDRFLATGARAEFGESAHKGMALFFSDRLACSTCHAGFNLSGAVVWHRSPKADAPLFHHNGLSGTVKDGEQGLIQHTGRRQDQGRFRAPTLRNIELTAPYMHDGSLPTLDAVLDHYVSQRAQRAIRRDRKGREQRALSRQGLELSATERTHLLAFLRSLTDRSFIENPRFSDPFSS